MCYWVVIIVLCTDIEFCLVKGRAIIHMVLKCSFCQNIPLKIYLHVIDGKTEAAMFEVTF